MLYVSLVLVLFLLVVAHIIVWWSKTPVLAFLIFGLLFTLAPLCLMFFSYPTALQAFFLLVAVMAWHASKWGRWWFVPFSGVATLLTCGMTTLLVRNAEQHDQQLREEFAYESMAARVRPPTPAARAGKLPQSVGQRLADLESDVEYQENQSSWSTYQLKRLHEDRVSLFVNSPGFGVARMLRPYRGGLTSRLRTEPTPPQPGMPSLSTGDLEVGSQPWSGPDLFPLHQESMLDFVYVAGFGFFKDRRHVAGFRPHQFSTVPRPVERLEVETLDLIGLLLHDEPVAYVSAKLPRMDELRDAPTRPLDTFEAAGLAAIRGGDDLYVRRVPDGARMVGALRATKQCVACHGCERGDMLGAFSYRLRRVAP